MTFGTRYSPAATCAAFSWYSSWRSLSLTTSARSRCASPGSGCAIGVTFAVSTASRAPMKSRMLERLCWYTGISVALRSRRAKEAMLASCSRVRAIGGSRCAWQSEKTSAKSYMLPLRMSCRLLDYAPLSGGLPPQLFRSLHAQTLARLFLQRSVDRPGYGEHAHLRARQGHRAQRALGGRGAGRALAGRQGDRRRRHGGQEHAWPYAGAHHRRAPHEGRLFRRFHLHREDAAVLYQ